MINPLDLVPKTALAALIVVLTFTNLKAHWDRNGLILDVQVGKTQIAQLEAAIDKANADAATQAATLIARTLKAENDAKKREAVLVAEKHDLDTALDGLRLSTSKARATYRLSGPATTTQFIDPTTGYDLFDQCAERYTSLAETCDGHVSDIKTLIDSWPKTETK